MSKFEKLFSRLFEHHGEESAKDPKTKNIFNASLGSFLTKITDSDPLYNAIEKKVREMAESDNKESMEEVTENIENKKSVKFRIKKNEIGEYVVKVYINGKYDDHKSYFTDDKQDAINTLNTMKNWYTNKGYIITEARKKYGKVNPWAVCTSKVGRDDKKKYERCVKDVKKSHVIDKG